MDVADSDRYRVHGYGVNRNRTRLVTNRPQSVVEVHPSSVNRVEITGVTVEYSPRRRGERSEGSTFTVSLPAA